MEIEVADKVMVQVGEDHYHAGSGFSARREQGLTPNGNPIGGRWVLRDPQGKWVDVNQYRSDLFEGHGFDRTSRFCLLPRR